MRTFFNVYIFVICCAFTHFVNVETQQFPFNNRITFPGPENNDFYRFQRPQSNGQALQYTSSLDPSNPFREPTELDRRPSRFRDGNGHRRWSRRSFHNNGNFNWYGPHRPTPNHFHDFLPIYNEIDRKAQPSDYNETTENFEINEDFDGRSIVAPGQYPHMAAIGFRSSRFQLEFKCGGSLINELFVLTAAHCCYFNGQLPNVIKIGDVKLKEFELDLVPQRRHVADIILHPYYNSSLHYNDIALIQLNKPVEFSYFVRPIRLWTREEIPYEKLHTMGYGSTSFAKAPTNILTELELSVVPNDNCKGMLPSDDNAPNGVVESQICAKDFEKNRDTCQGDSGGPLQLNLERRRRHRRLRYYLVGITSYGTACRSQYPGVYTRVSYYIDWIASIVWPNYFENYYQNYQNNYENYFPYHYRNFNYF